MERCCLDVTEIFRRLVRQVLRLLGQLRESKDVRQRLVQLVCHAGRELSDGGEAVGVP